MNMGYDQIAEMYTPLSSAVERHHEDYTTDSLLPEAVPPGRYAVFARQIATPSFEVERFLTLAEDAGLRPLFLEFHGDKFVTRNSCKLALARMRFIDDPMSEGPVSISTVVDIQAFQGKPFSCVTTLWGEPLVDFHHRLLKTIFPAASSAVIVDGTMWFRQFGLSPSDYYERFLSLFVTGCILFESYLLHPEEADFTRNVVIPAFKSVREKHRKVPLIARLDPPASEGHKCWTSYPLVVEREVSRTDASLCKIKANNAIHRMATRVTPHA